MDKVYKPLIELPPELRKPHIDVLVIYADTDKCKAEDFIELLRMVCASCKEPIRIEGVDAFYYISTSFRRLEEAVNYSTYMFLFLTKSFVDDAWTSLSGDACLQESLENPDKRWCVIPIHTQARASSDYNQPFGLKPLKGIHCDHVIKSRRESFMERSDLNDVIVENIDQYFARQIKSLVEGRLYLRKERERRQKVAIDKYLMEKQFQLDQQEMQDKMNLKRRKNELKMAENVLDNARKEQLKKSESRFTEDEFGQRNIPRVRDVLEMPHNQQAQVSRNATPALFTFSKSFCIIFAEKQSAGRSKNQFEHYSQYSTSPRQLGINIR